MNPSVETRKQQHGEREVTVATVSFELPEEVVEEISETHGELTPDRVCDRVIPIALVDDDPV